MQNTIPYPSFAIHLRYEYMSWDAPQPDQSDRMPVATGPWQHRRGWPRNVHGDRVWPIETTASASAKSAQLATIQRLSSLRLVKVNAADNIYYINHYTISILPLVLDKHIQMFSYRLELWTSCWQAWHKIIPNLTVTPQKQSPWWASTLNKYIWIVLSSGQGISPVCDPLWPLTAFHLEPWSTTWTAMP